MIPRHTIMGGEQVPKRRQIAPSRRPVGNGEHHLLEGTGERPCERTMEVPRGAGGIVAEGAAAPGAKNQRRVTEGAGDGQHAADACLHQVARQRLADGGGIGRRAGQEAQGPGRRSRAVPSSVRNTGTSGDRIAQSVESGCGRAL